MATDTDEDDKQIETEEEMDSPNPAPVPVIYCCAASFELIQAKEKIQALEYEINSLTLYNQDLFKKLQKKDSLREGQFVIDVKELLKKVLSADQIDQALGIKKRVNWSDGDLSKAFGLRYVKGNHYPFMEPVLSLFNCSYYSLNAYNYVREKLFYPLPSGRTLAR